MAIDPRGGNVTSFVIALALVAAILAVWPLRSTAQAPSHPTPGVMFFASKKPPQTEFLRFTTPSHLDGLPAVARAKIAITPHATLPGVWVLEWGNAPGAQAEIRPGDYIRMVDADSVRVVTSAEFADGWDWP